MEKFNDRTISKDENLELKMRMARAVIEEKVRKAMEDYDRTVKADRVRLQERIADENKRLWLDSETIKKNQINASIADMRRKCEELEKQRKRERDEFIEKQRTLQKILSYDETRELVMKERQNMIQKDRMWQIEEKLSALQKYVENDKFYHNLMIRNVEKAIEEDREASMRRWQKQKEIKLAFDMQIQDKEQVKIGERLDKERERRDIEMMIERNKEFDLKEQREKMERAKILAMEMLQYKEKQQKILEERKNAEKYIQEQISIIKHESDNKIDKSKIKEELDCYRQHAEEIKRKQEIEKRRFEDYLEKLNKEKQQWEEKERKKVLTAKGELAQMVLKEREGQMEYRKEKEREEHNEKVNEIKRLQKEQHDYKTLREEAEEKARERKRLYAKELQEQIRVKNERKRLEQEENLHKYKAMQESEENRQREIQKFTKEIGLSKKDLSKFLQ